MRLIYIKMKILKHENIKTENTYEVILYIYCI